MESKGDEIISINVIIADRPYPLKVERKEEENIRIAAKKLNEKIKEFQLKYDAKDKQDYLAMSALMYTVDAVKNDVDNKEEMIKLEDRITRLHKSLA
ncbi:MAG: cell division protein ZapA [Chitinophagales bacterium]|nr:cell division protein ZapA [Chitinophagales bacterium]